MMYNSHGVGFRVNMAAESANNERALLLLHGFTGSSETWTPFIPHFSKRYNTITVDLIGHGLSEAPPNPEQYSLERAADDMITLMDQLALNKIHLLGYSMGGRLALMIACKYPDRVSSLILESSSPGLKSEIERRNRIINDNQLASFIEKEGIESFVNHWENIPLFQTQKRVPLEVREKLRQDRLAHSKIGLANSLRGMGTGQQQSLWPCLSQLSFPILLMAGEHDTKYVAIAKEMAKLLPQAVTTIAPQTGHAVHFEEQEWFRQTVLRFLHHF